MRQIFDAAVQADSFRGKALLNALVPALPKGNDLQVALEALTAAWPGTSIGAKVFLGIVRWSFLIELVKKPKIETTKFEVRWAERVGDTDPRFATYDECLAMCELLATQAAKAIQDKAVRDLLAAFAGTNLVPYELPLDYKERVIDGPLHAATNVHWLWGALVHKTIILRAYLLSSATGTHRTTFDIAYKNKIEVKTYLTDRVQTGDHKTNREKRWETHPASVHYALRAQCLEIEHELMHQVCRFEGFPPEIRKQLEDKNLLDKNQDHFRCPITLDKLSFKQFEQELQNPVAGRSSFQVGHLNPLKAVNNDPKSGHTAANISWVSANGNRIQGSLSLAETRAMIRHIASNYEAFKIA
ncbi:MAG: hypothetical protein IPK87_00975 [Planctomycetes bacterium]|nr:hypothetical protein [Planctomycetota bacterium]